MPLDPRPSTLDPRPSALGEVLRSVPSKARRYSVASLLAVMLIPQPSSGGTGLGLTFDDHIVSADFIGHVRVVAVHSIVLEDGYPITEYELTPIDVMTGTWRAEGERLRLPGGWKNGEWMAAGAPKLDVGQTITIFGRRDRNQVLLRLSENRSLYLTRGPDGDRIATDAAGNPVVEVACGHAITIARPAEQETEGALRPASGLTFAADPEAIAMRWSDFVGQVAGCVASRNAEVSP